MGANSSKMHLLRYIHIAFWNIKGQAAPPKHLFYAVTEIGRDQYAIIEKSAYYILLNMAVTHSTELAISYSQLICMISLAIAVRDAYTK